MPNPMPIQNISTFLPTIFSFACDKSAENPVVIPFRAFDVRYKLALVCRSWSQIIWSTSSLWTRIHFATTGHGDDEVDLLLCHFNLCIVRSRPNSVDVSFDIPGERESSFIPRVLAPHAHYVRHLRCRVYGNVNIYNFLSMASGCFEALKSLDLCLVISPEQTIPPFPLEAYSRFHSLAIAPRLRSVIVRLHDNLQPLALRLPWGQLTFLDLVTTTLFPESLLTIFRICAPRLQSGYFYIKFDKPVVPGLPLSNGSITMWALRSLRLKLLYPDADGRLFSILQFPSLQNIWIELHNSFQEWNLILYTNLLRASSNSLRLLMLSDFIPNVEGQVQGNDNHLILRRPHDTPYHATAIEGLFQVASNIEALYLPVGLHVDGTTLDKIACCILLPRLRMLELGAINAWHVISSVRRRHLNVLTSTAGHSRIARIQMLVPENMYHGIEKTALDAEVRALNFLDITFQIKPTCILPLPQVVHG